MTQYQCVLYTKPKTSLIHHVKGIHDMCAYSKITGGVKIHANCATPSRCPNVAAVVMQGYSDHAKRYIS